MSAYSIRGPSILLPQWPRILKGHLTPRVPGCHSPLAKRDPGQAQYWLSTCGPQTFSHVTDIE